ncbi:MAG: hypothetical protein GX650_05625 [Clostridiales bacterium]|nr:hypothetical protein [Clostridiales bacterium]
MDVTPITQKIQENARLTAEGYLNEARARIADLQESTDTLIRKAQQQAQEDARRDGDAMEKNMRRLHELEMRKQLLQMKRGLLDEGFTQALEALRAQDSQKLRALFLYQTVQSAQGNEKLAVGAISPAFFDESFVKEANTLLEKSGRPAGLTDGGERREGVCGVILQGQGVETYCTLESLLDARRADLEPAVAGILGTELR